MCIWDLAGDTSIVVIGFIGVVIDLLLLALFFRSRLLVVMVLVLARVGLFCLVSLDLFPDFRANTGLIAEPLVFP